LVTSDKSNYVRLESLKIIIRDFLDKGIDAIHYVIKHESSADNLYALYKELETMESEVGGSLKNEMEQSIGEKYINKFNLIAKEAMALQLIDLVVGVEAVHKIYWHDASCFAVKPENGKVVDLVIYEFNFPEIKYLDLFSQLNSLTISDAGVKEMANLQTLKNLKYLDLSFNEIREIKGLETLTELETLNVNDNPIRRIEGIDHLKHLKDVNFEETLISEGDYYDFYYQFIPYLLKDADSYCLTKKYDKTIENCKRVIELDPEQPNPYYYLGLVYYETNEKHKAIHYYKKAIKLDKKLKKVWYHLGISYFDLKKNILAINAFKLALNSKSRDIKDEYIWIYLAEIYSRKKLNKEALRSGFKAIEINPQYWNAYTHTGYYYFKLEKYEDAIKIFKKALKMNPSDFFSRNYLGLSLVKIEKFEESRIIFEKIIKFNPKNSTARINLGLLCMKFNHPREAIRHFKEVANNRNLDDTDCYILAYNLKRLKEHNLAFNLINRGLNKNPKNKILIKLKEDVLKKESKI